LLASGCQVSEGWADAALARFGDRQVAAVVPLVWDAAASDKLLAAGIGYRPSGRRYLVARGQKTLEAPAQQSIIGPCGFAGFYRKAALDFVGGFCPRLAARQADADVALALGHAGFSVAIEPRSQLRATRDADACPGPRNHSLSDERLFWRNWTGAGRTGALAAHAGRVMLEVLTAFGRPRMLSHLAGRLQGALELVGHARHRQALAELEARSIRPAAVPQQMLPEHTRIDRSHRAPARADVRVHAQHRQAG
jgi:hypothetical protein